MKPKRKYPLARVQSEDEETSLVIVHDKPYDNSFGKVKWRIKVQHQSKADEKVIDVRCMEYE